MMPLDDFSRRMRAALKGRPMPLIVEPDGRTCPGASLDTGAWAVARALHDAGYRPGDRIAYSGAKSIAFVQAMLGTLRAGMVFCPLGPKDPALLARSGARLVLDERILQAAFDGGLPTPGEGATEAEAGIRFWTSGSTGDRKAITVPSRVLDAQVASHGPALALSERDTIVSYLPWNHAFGGVLELLCGLCAGAEIEIVGGPFDPDALARAILRAERPWLFTVPKGLTALAASPGGTTALTRLRGGIVGGAPVDRRLCDLVGEFEVPLRVGYGQTECGPGVTLGDPGVFRPGYLGRPLGCTVWLSEVGEILVAGPNVCLPTVSGELATGDLAVPDGEGGYLFRGRCAGGWKWSNGKRFFPESLTSELPAEVCLLKTACDAVAIVGFEDGFQTPSLPVSIVATVVVPSAFRDACRTATGKLSAMRTATVVRHLFPDLPLDPFLYPPGEAETKPGSSAALSAT